MSSIYDLVFSFTDYLNPFAYSNPFYSSASSTNSINLEKDYANPLVEKTRNLTEPMVVNRQFIIDKLMLLQALEKMEEKKKIKDL
jgi:hypothetical protein